MLVTRVQCFVDESRQQQSKWTIAVAGMHQSDASKHLTLNRSRMTSNSPMMPVPKPRAMHTKMNAASGLFEFG